ncbi:MAG: META domain-containing protein [Acidimicrobiia bacterium]
MKRHLLWVAVVVLAGCTGSTVRPTGSHRPAATLVGTWTPVVVAGYAESLSGSRWPEPPQLRFTRTTWSGSDGCNGEYGTYTLGRGGRFGATAGPTTKIGCSNVPNVGVLLRATHARVVRGHTLVFTSRSGSILGRYDRDTLPTAACGAAGLPPTMVQLQLVGGPTDQRRPLPGVVTATSSTGARCGVRIGLPGSARLELRPGRYTFTGRSPLYGSGRSKCRADDPIPLRVVNVDCQAK